MVWLNRGSIQEKLLGQRKYRETALPQQPKKSSDRNGPRVSR